MRYLSTLSCVCALVGLGCGSDAPQEQTATTAAPTDATGLGTTTTGGLATTGTTGASTGTTASTTSVTPATTSTQGTSTTGTAAGTTTSGGVTGTTGTTGGTTTAPTDDAGAAADSGEANPDVDGLEPFSFFVTSLEIMRELSGSQDGFGGDFGGLEGADEICRQAADAVGFGAKTWRAFLSATDGGDGQPVHAIDRIGEGPWYDRNGRLVAQDINGLLAADRPAGDAQTVEDLPNEFGQGLKQFGDTHDILTGSNAQGQLNSEDPANTCNDWTSVDVEPAGGGGRGGFGGGIMCGHSWPAMSGTNWITAHGAHSCKAGVNLDQNGAGDGSSVGAGGGWGAIYCFALQP